MVIFGGWMEWDAEAHNWRIPQTTVRDTNLEAFEREPETGMAKCRPCSEESHAECDGEGCTCSLCFQIAPVVHECEVDWDWRDRERSWPS
jgi:hypothetical protein